MGLTEFINNFISSLFAYVDHEDAPEEIIVHSKVEASPLEWPFENTKIDFPCVFAEIINTQITTDEHHYGVQISFRVIDVINTTKYKQPKLESRLRGLKIAKNLAVTRLGVDSGFFSNLMVGEEGQLNGYFMAANINLLACEITGVFQVRFDEEL